MSTVIVPFIPSIPNYRFATVLDSQTFIFDVRWNGRNNSWYFDLLNEDEEPIRNNVRVVLGALLSIRATAEDSPLGIMQALDSSQSGAEAGFDDLGDRVEVYYYELADLQ